MSTLSVQEQVLFDVAKSSLPKILFTDPASQQEIFAAFAKELSQSQTQIKFWHSMSYILSATGIWLDQHAKDRGTARQANESDEALRARLRDFLQTVTLEELKLAITNTLIAYGVTIPAGYPGIVELRNDRAYFNTLPGYIQCIAGEDIVDGETVTIDDGTSTVVFEFNKAGGVTGLNTAVPVSDTDTAADVANALLAQLLTSGLLLNEGLSSNRVGRILLTHTAPPTRFDISETVSDTAFSVQGQGNAAFFSRGYRMGDERNEIIVILPYGTPAGAAASVAEALRQKKAAGIGIFVETRGVP